MSQVLIDFKYVVVYVFSQRTFDGVDVLLRLSDDFNIEGESSSFFDSVFEEMLSIDYTRWFVYYNTLNILAMNLGLKI